MASRCTTCNVSFETMEAMRAHYGTELHLQNVRLRVEGKRPLTRAEFHQSGAAAATEGSGGAPDDDRPSFYCKLCSKMFRSVQTLQSHVKSTAHLMKKEQRILARDSDAASMLTSTSLGSAAIGLHRRHKAHHKAAMRQRAENAAAPKVSVDDREEDCGALRCLFCGLPSSTLEASLEHLHDTHNFVIPLDHRCSNPTGFLDYLGRKINGLMCIVCNDKSKRFETIEAVRAHMLGCAHQRIELNSEYQEFYDGLLENFDKQTEPKFVSNQLVVTDGKTVFKRDTQGGLFQRHRETDGQCDKRRAITNATNDAQALIKQERYEAQAPAIKQAHRDLREAQRKYLKYSMQQGVKGNKLHPKGYDGEGEVN